MKGTFCLKMFPLSFNIKLMPYYDASIFTSHNGTYTNLPYRSIASLP